MISAFAKAFAQLTDGVVLRVLFLSVIVAVVVYIALVAGTVWLLGRIDLGALPWMDTVAEWGGGLAAVVIAALLFPGILSAVMGFWLEDVAAAVERRHYPLLPPAKPTAWYDSLMAALRLGAATVGINIVLLPVYLVLIFIPPLSLALYYAVNGLFLGREYFEVVALRRMDSAAAAELRRRNRGAVWAAGAVTAGLLTVPVLNLAAPAIGTAAMTHVFARVAQGVFQKLTAGPLG